VTRVRKTFGSRLHVLAILWFITLACVIAEPKPSTGQLSLPDKDWGVGLNLPGFKVKTIETKPDGRRYMAAQNETTYVVVSLFLEQHKTGARTRSCRESLEKKAKNPPLKVQDVCYSRSGDLDVMRDFVPEFKGRRALKN
jgi:hypothetical protein